ncbi:hypothetical protein ScPMuIL_007902 [Solemya velum]
MPSGENELFLPLAWQSKRMRVVQRTLAVETLALADAVDTGLFLTTFFSDLSGENTEAAKIPIVCLIGNHFLFEAVKSTKSVADKRLKIELSSIKELINEKNVQGLLADCLTKKRASSLKLLKVVDRQESTQLLPVRSVISRQLVTIECPSDCCFHLEVDVPFGKWITLQSCLDIFVSVLQSRKA